MFTFQQGSTLIVRGESTSREFLVGNITASQTFLEQSREVKTLHKNNTLSEIFTVSKSNTSISFDVYVGTLLDGILLEWAGFVKSGNKFLINPSLRQAIPYTLDIKSFGTSYTITNVFLENISISMAKNSPLMFKITASGGDLQIGTSPAAAATKQNSSEFIFGTINNFNSLGGLTCEITRGLQWLNQNTVHKAVSNIIYTSDTAICDSLSIAGSITTYKKNNTQIQNNTNETIEFVYANKFKCFLDICNTFTRYDMSEVHRHIKDYKLQSSTTGAYFEFI